MPFGQHQDMRFWNNQFPETKILGLSASRRMHGLVYMASRDKVDVDKFHQGIQYALERLEKSKFGFESATVSNFKSKSHEGSGNKLVDYSRAPCLGADQKARGLWERDWIDDNARSFWGSIVKTKHQSLTSLAFMGLIPGADPVVRHICIRCVAWFFIEFNHKARCLLWVCRTRPQLSQNLITVLGHTFTNPRFSVPEMHFVLSFYLQNL